MPKLIDHAERDRVIADAAWTVLSREGLTGFSVRNVAEEAGLATASLRRRFPTQDALRVYSLALVARRVQARMDAVDIDPAADPRAYVIACLEQFLPLDSERRVEMQAFLALSSLSSANPAVAAACAEAHASMALACRSLLALLSGSEPAAGNAEVRARRLHALLDGLALHLVQQPADGDPRWALEVLENEVGARS